MIGALLIGLILITTIYLIVTADYSNIKVGNKYKKKPYKDITIEIVAVKKKNKSISYKFIEIYGKKIDDKKVYVMSINGLNKDYEIVK